MVKQSDYPEAEVQACFSVLLELMTVLGEFREDIVIVGGNVPPLLIPSAKEKYPGTLDIDLALDFKHISDDTYKTIIETLRGRGYFQKEDEQPFIFYRDVGDESGNKITVEIDLLAGEYGGTGKGRRHQRIQDAQARKARGCDLVFDSAVKVNLAGTLPGGAKNEVSVKVPSIGPFLAMKDMTLWERMKEKDAYDIYYCCRNYPGGLAGLVEAINPLVKNRLAKEGLEKIKTKFYTVDGIGPTWVADFLEIADPEERARVQREAFELVNALWINSLLSPSQSDFIDSQNLNLSIHYQGWVLDFRKFRRYLYTRYHVTKAFLFIGYVYENQALYINLQKDEYILVFKPTLELPSGKVKGNVDAELVLHTMIEYKNYDKALIVTGDGDFAYLAAYLHKADKLQCVLVPNMNKYSGLLKKTAKNYLAFMNDLREKLKYKRKEPHKDRTSQGAFRNDSNYNNKEYRFSCQIDILCYNSQE